MKICVSTIPFKKKEINQTLTVFKELEFNDVELHLHHFIVNKEDPRIVKRFGLNIVMLSGGWCNFFNSFSMGDHLKYQVDLVDEFKCKNIRLFFGQIDKEEFTTEVFDRCVSNLQYLSTTYPNLVFFLENHTPSISNDPIIIKRILDVVNRENIKMNFDIENFNKAGYDPFSLVSVFKKYIGHVHVKTTIKDFSIIPYIQLHKYDNYFSIENETTENNPYLNIYETYKKLIEVGK